MPSLKYGLLAVLAFIPFVVWLFALPVVAILVSRTFLGLWDKFSLYKIKRTLESAPSIGEKDIDGTYHFKWGKFGVRYTVLQNGPSAGVSGINPVRSNPAERDAQPSVRTSNGVKIISVKRKLSWPEIKIAHFKKRVENIWYYQKWLGLFEPTIFGLLVIVGLFLYFGLVEPEGAKVMRFRYLAAWATGLSPERIQPLDGGWVRIFGKRTTRPDQFTEPFFYDVNVFDWLSFRSDGYVVRYRGEPYGQARHPVTFFDYAGKAILEKEGKDVEVGVSGIQYGSPQGSGIRYEKIGSQSVTVQGDLNIKDLPPSETRGE